MNLSQAQYDQLTLEFGMAPARVDQIVRACTEDDLLDIIAAERIAGSVTTVTAWERFVEILRDAKEIASDLLPIFQVAVVAATLLPLI